MNKWFERLDRRHFFDWMPDSWYLQMKYKQCMGYSLNLSNPKTFNEKLQWLKLHDRNPEYTMMVDKYAVRKYIADTIGEEYLIPLFGVWDNPDDIDFDALPNQFVLKCTHDSGGIVICKDKSKLNQKWAKRKLENRLKRNYYWLGREWPYRDVKPRIIAEKYMEDSNVISLRDYKFFCFNGKMKCLYISTGSHSDNQKLQFFDRNYNALPITRDDYFVLDEIPEKPIHLEDMINLAELLSKDIPHARIDFYYIQNKIYFGEITFFTGSGWIPFTEKKWDYKLGSWIKLPIE